MRAPPTLTPRQLENPHLHVKGMGGILRSSATTVLERSFLDPAREGERALWWERGVVCATLADPVRGAALVSVFMERHERHGNMDERRLRRWNREEGEEWSRLWDGWVAALAARGASPDEDMLARAWAITAMRHPSMAILLERAGADPHRSFLPSGRIAAVATSGWLVVLEATCGFLRQSGTSQPGTGSPRKGKYLVEALDRTWRGDWAPTIRERALVALSRMTWSLPADEVLPPWVLRFRDCLLADGADPLLDLDLRSTVQSSPLALWWESISSRHSVFSDASRRAIQEWGEALVRATDGPVSFSWGDLSFLPAPSALMRTLIQRKSVPWEIPAAPPGRTLLPFRTRHLHSFRAEPGSAEAIMRRALDWNDSPGFGSSLGRPLGMVAQWLEAWADASPDATVEEEGFRRQVFMAWTSLLSSSSPGTGSRWSHGDGPPGAQALQRIGLAWRRLLGAQWMTVLRGLGHAVASYLPPSAWAAILGACSPAEIASFATAAAPVHAMANDAILAKSDLEWWARHSFPVAALGNLLCLPACRQVACRFMATPEGGRLRSAVWPALVCNQPADIAPGEVDFWVGLAGRPALEQWGPLVSRALLVNPPMARVLLGEEFRPLSPGTPPFALASAWIDGLMGSKTRLAGAGDLRYSGYLPRDEWRDRRAALVDLVAMGHAPVGTTAGELLKAIASRARGLSPTLSQWPPHWVAATTAMVELGLWDGSTTTGADSVLAPLLAHANSLYLESSLPVAAPPAASRLRL